METQIATENTNSTIGGAFSHISVCPPDSILGVLQAYNRDTFSGKVNLSVGAYRDDDGKPFVLRSVRLAEEKIFAKNLNKEYSPQDGIPEYNRACQGFLLGKENPVVKDGKVCTIQTLSGTGALRIGFEFVKKFLKDAVVYVPHITWGNHYQILDEISQRYVKYPYWDAKNKCLDLKGMLGSLESAPKGSVILLHMCAHNPTGVDPTQSQWKQIAQVCKARNHVIFMDNAYQGYASGDLVKDAYSIRLFAEMQFDIICAQSFAKNFGLYGERIGALHFITPDVNAIPAIRSQLAFLARVLYSNPPLHGARIVVEILSDEKLYALWEEDLKTMSGRIIQMRQKLLDSIIAKKTPGDWTHITSQIGMFSFTGLSPKQVEKMIGKYHIYMLSNGRISMAGINSKNVDYVAAAINDCVVNDK